jgi:signal transduction histidine kinase/CheY-like chemotaxis protein
MSVPSLIFLGTLLVISGVLFFAWIRAQRTIRELSAKLEEARLRQISDERELSQRSALDSIKDEFVSTVSHELRTPLTSIRGALGLLSSGVLGNVDAQAKNLLRIALTNTERLIRLINDILDLQRMDSGRSVLQVRRCSLPELVHQAIETMNSMADAAEVRLVVSPAAKQILPSVFFDGDSDRILQVITNLLSNAIKFSPAGSDVTIEVDTPPEALVFRVSDQGRGIPEDQLEMVFERFKQVEHEDAGKRGGTGLGLAICRSIIQQHGGTIWAQRNPSRGTSVCVKLPRLQRTYDVSPLEHESAVPRNPASGSRSAVKVADVVVVPPADPVPNPGDNAVLICDDDAVHRGLTANKLRGQGHIVLEASSSDEAIEIATSRSADNPLQAILLDLHMSDMKGWELLRVLTKNVATASIPVVVLSVQSAEELARPVGSGFLSEHRFAELGRAIDSGSGPSQVLLVEDDEDLAHVVLAGFAKTGVMVNHATTLERAMTVCRGRRPDLIILDLTLPDGDGFSMVDWLRGKPELRSMPLIVYSGREVSQDERMKLRLGPTRFLTKARVQTQDIEQLVLRMVQNGRFVGPDSGERVVGAGGSANDVYRGAPPASVPGPSTASRSRRAQV